MNTAGVSTEKSHDTRRPHPKVCLLRPLLYWLAFVHLWFKPAFPQTIESSAGEASISPFIPAAAVLYGPIANNTGRPDNCYPIEEAAKFSLLDLSPYLVGQTSRWCGTPDRALDAIRALNPNSIILVYHFGPGGIKWAGYPVPAGGDSTYQALRATHGLDKPDPWFEQGHHSGDYLVDMYYPVYMAMKLSHPDWRRFWREKTWEGFWGPTPQIDVRGTNGILVDGSQAHAAYSHYPFCPLSQWTGSGCTGARDTAATYWTPGRWNDALWGQHMLQAVSEIVPFFKARGLEAMFNVWRLQPNYLDLLNQVGGWAMEECGFICAVIQRRFPPNPRHWEERLNMLRSAKRAKIMNTNVLVDALGSAGPGKGIEIMDTLISDPATGRTWRGWDVLWFAMTSFLLGYEPTLQNAYFHFTAWGYRDCYWFDEYDPRYLHLGLPLDTARKLSSGAWEREFERGWVWVNPTNTDITLTIPQDSARILNHYNFKNPGSVPAVTQFVLPAWTGVVGLRAGMTMAGIEKPDKTPPSFILYPNEPNPFHHTSTIRFFIPQPEYVILKVFDAFGREIATLADEQKQAGEHSVIFDAKNLPGGLYFVQMRTRNNATGRSMMVVK